MHAFDGYFGCKDPTAGLTFCTIANDITSPIVTEKVNFQVNTVNPKLLVDSAIDVGQMLISFKMTSSFGTT